jgi:hypothetical protein
MFTLQIMLPVMHVVYSSQLDNIVIYTNSMYDDELQSITTTCAAGRDYLLNLPSFRSFLSLDPLLLPLFPIPLPHTSARHDPHASDRI